jgi:flagellar export protein FliJ
MKAFKFKLESILMLREQAKAVSEQNHAAASRRLELVLLELSRAAEEAGRLAGMLERMQRTSFRPAERDVIWNGMRQQQQVCAELNAKVETARKELEEKRCALLAANADFEAMVKLREKARVDHARAAELAENAMIDDIVSARHAAMRRDPGRKENL